MGMESCNSGPCSAGGAGVGYRSWPPAKATCRLGIVAFAHESDNCASAQVLHLRERRNGDVESEGQGPSQTGISDDGREGLKMLEMFLIEFRRCKWTGPSLELYTYAFPGALCNCPGFYGAW